MLLWEDAQYDDVVNEAAENWFHAVKKVTQDMGMGHRYEFANYAGPFQDIMASYGPENHQFLKEVSHKYDPRGLFQKAVKGGYKLSPPA